MFRANETLLERGGSDRPDSRNVYAIFLFHAIRIGHGYLLTLSHMRSEALR